MKSRTRILDHCTYGQCKEPVDGPFGWLCAKHRRLRKHHTNPRYRVGKAYGVCRRIKHAFDQLTLVDLCGLSLSEIVQMVGCSRVSASRHRARRIKELLKEGGK